MTTTLSDLSRHWRATAKGYLADLDGWSEGLSAERAMACSDAFQRCADDLDAALTPSASTETPQPKEPQPGDVRQVVASAVSNLRQAARKVLRMGWKQTAQNIDGAADLLSALAAQPSEVERTKSGLLAELRSTRLGGPSRERAIEIAEELAKLTSPPAPSGRIAAMQQRIAAMIPWLDTGFGPACRFCGTLRDSTPEHARACLWQNAKDALPPAPDASPATTCGHCGDGGVIPTQHGPVCATCYHPIEADASPAKPILSALDQETGSDEGMTPLCEYDAKRVFGAEK